MDDEDHRKYLHMRERRGESRESLKESMILYLTLPIVSFFRPEREK